MTKIIQSICFACNPRYLKPGSLVPVNKIEGHFYCKSCGKEIQHMNDLYGDALKRWDTYFHNICIAVATKSPCLSRQIGAILVRDKSIISTGYNGPARGYPHCGDNIDDWMIDTHADNIEKSADYHTEKKQSPPECPRKLAGFKSGEGLELCPASHAEMNCIANAARNGVNCLNSTLYMNCIIPCKFCAVILVNAGISTVVVDDVKPYHEMSIKILAKGNVKIRRFKLCE